METILKTNALTKRYGKQLACDNVSLEIKRGDIYGFVGKNGAGKTTIIRMIAGIANPTNGEFDLFGINSKDPKICQSRRRIAAIVEGPSIYMDMSAKENLIMQCKILGIKEDNINDVLKEVGLEEQINSKKKVKNFSLGMRQRIGIAISLMSNPDFLILDEPMNGLDPQGIVEMRELIIKLNKQLGITFLISSHILDELSKVANKYGFIDSGRLIKQITTEELEEQAQKCIEMSLSDISNVGIILDKLKIQKYKVTENNKIRIYGQFNINSLIVEFDKNNISVNDIKHIDGGIEEYYINLIGGKLYA